MKSDDKPDSQMSKFKSRWGRQYPTIHTAKINQTLKKAANAKRRRRDRKATEER